MKLETSSRKKQYCQETGEYSKIQDSAFIYYIYFFFQKNISQRTLNEQEANCGGQRRAYQDFFYSQLISSLTSCKQRQRLRVSCLMFNLILISWSFQRAPPLSFFNQKKKKTTGKYNPGERSQISLTIQLKRHIREDRNVAYQD